MKRILTGVLLCLSLTLIAGSLFIPVPDVSKPAPAPRTSAVLSERSLLLIISDLLDLMRENPYNSAGIYTQDSKGNRQVTTIPSWKDLKIELELTQGERVWFITVKAIEVLTAGKFTMIYIAPIDKPSNQRA